MKITAKQITALVESVNGIAYSDVVLVDRYGNNPDWVNEISLSRVWQHFTRAKGKTFGVVSASRQENTDKKNLELTAQLRSEIRTLGYGYNELIGHTIECADKKIKDWKKCPKDKQIDVVESSFFIPGLTIVHARMLRAKYDQDSVLFGNEKGIGDITRDDVFNIFLDKFSPNAISKYFSDFKRKRGGKVLSFHFEGTPGSVGDSFSANYATKLTVGEVI